MPTTSRHRASPTRTGPGRFDFVRPEPYAFDDLDELSDATVDRDSMARAGVRGSASTIAGSWLKFVVTTGTMIVLAHILVPADFGIVAMVTAVSGFGELLRDLGLSLAVIQTPRLTRGQASTMFWYSVGFGAVIGAGLAAATPWISTFYDQPHLDTIVPVMAAGIVVSSAGAQHIALLDRALGFTRVMVSDIVSSVVACALALVLAYLGAGYWALVALYVTTSAVRTVLAWLNVRWWPGRPEPYRHVSGLVRFGFDQLVAQLLNYFSRNLDNVIVGRLFGSRILGQYAQAYLLLLLPLQQVNAPLQRVAVPLLSRATAEPGLYREYFRMAIRLMGLLLVPIFCVAAVLSDGLIHLVLGPRWAASAEIFRILCLAGVTQSVGYALSWLFISTGQTRRQVRYALVSRPVVIASFFVGAHWGVNGVALGYSITSAAILVPSFAYAMRFTPLRTSDLFVGLRELLIVAPLVSAVAWGVQRLADNAGFGTDNAFLAAAAASAVVYLLTWQLVPSCRATAAQIIGIARRPQPVN